MVTLWFVLLGVLFAGYFALAGADYGTALLMRAAPPERRREVLAATGPFFLGNEVWLVAAVGVLFGAFPRLEGELLSALYPVLVALLVALIGYTAAVQLRGRWHAGAKAGWDALIVGGAGIVAVGWGVFLGALLNGLPLDADGHRSGSLFSPVAVVSGLAFAALVAVHGAVFLTWRSTVDVRRLVPVLSRAAAVLVGAVVALAAVGVTGVEPLIAVPGAVAVIALVLVAPRLSPARATLCTGLACGLPVLVIGAARWPVALASTADPAGTLTVAEAAAGPATLGVLVWFAALVLPLVAAFQGMCWWAFRGDRRPVFW
ncbi:cytochrome d ubiquinol oxidase subunit II [Actinokineospora fastidiosa]|uniref:Cytochrome bd oxidase subunit II n=1 Tax=Actinokineospora fastidiosa TaxID=1816 RepID=A0A918G130_9PSEU|nr:cytochrome d ubiquinol oxidase subunit II [Actinokineospora fastidiosa]GGS13458.1 cytochrome bd oxidase subunit II [Actinokineospora fastidiosa]